MTLPFDTRGRGRPAICLPMFTLDRSVTAAALEPAFAGTTGWRRIYVDLPGFGEAPPGPENSDGMVEAVVEFIGQEAGSERVLLAGCSYGGYIAAAVARRIPERLAGLLLVVSGVRIRPEDRDLPAGPGMVAAEGWLNGVPEDLRDHLSVALGNRTAEAAQRVAAVVGASKPGDEEYLRRLRATGYPVSDEDSGAVFDGPTLIVVGRHDLIGGYADQFRATQRYPQASYAAVAHAGHYLPFERPEMFSALVREWLTALGTPAAGYPA